MSDDSHLPDSEEILSRERRFKGRRRPKTYVEEYQDIDGNWRKRIRTSAGKFSEQKKAEFLAIYGLHNRMREACDIVGVDPKTVREHMKTDKEFGEAVIAAEEKYKEEFLSHFQSLVFEGTEKVGYNREGEVISREIVYPIKLIEMEAKRLFPEFRDKQTIDHNHRGGVLVAPSSLGSIEEWEAKFSQSQVVDASYQEVIPLENAFSDEKSTTEIMTNSPRKTDPDD